MKAKEIASQAKKLKDQKLFLEAEELYLGAIHQAPGDPHILYQTALYYMQYSDFYFEKKSTRAFEQKTEDLLRKAIAADPSNTEYYATLASHLDTPRIGRHEEAEKLYQKALALDPSFRYLQENLGICYFNQKKYKQAENILLSYIRQESESNEKNLVRAYEFLGKNYQAQGKLEQARKALEKSAGLYDQYLAQHSDTSYWGCPYQSLGVLYSKIGNVAKRDENYLKSADLQPFKYFVQINAAIIAYRYGDHEKALHYINRALTARDSEDYRIVKGFILMALRRYEQADEIFKAQKHAKGSFSLAHWIADQGAKTGLGHLAIKDKNYKNAEKYFKHTVGGLKGAIAVQITKAMNFKMKDMLYDPFESYQVASFVYESACLGRGWTYSNQNRHKKAEKWFRQALDINPRSIVAKLALANSMMGQHQIEKAENMYNEILKESPGNRYALAELGGIYLTKGDLDLAEKKYHEALAHSDGTYTCPYEGLGLVFLQTGKSIEAKENFEKAIQINPDIEYKKFNGLAKIFIEEGKYKQAKKLLEKSIENYPHDAEAGRLLASLKNLPAAGGK